MERKNTRGNLKQQKESAFTDLDDLFVKEPMTSISQRNGGRRASKKQTNGRTNTRSKSPLTSGSPLKNGKDTLKKNGNH
jgi:hypothetical protein